MKYPYLSDRQKAHTASLVLIVVSALLGLVAIFTKNRIAYCAGAIVAVVFYAFAMHYLEFHNVQGQSIKKYVLAFHCFAIHALLLVFASFAGAAGTLSYQVLHGLADAFLMAALLTAARIYRKDLSLALIAALAVVTFVLALLNINTVLAIVLAVAGAVLAFLSYKDSLWAALFGCASAVMALLPLFNKATPDTHWWMHIVAWILAMLAAYKTYAVVEKEEDAAVTSRSNLSVNEEATKEEAPTRTIFPAAFEPEDSWFIKEYQGVPYEDLLNAPLTAFKGVSQKMADDMKDAFNIKTIGGLADNKFFRWAKEITDEADHK